MSRVLLFNAWGGPEHQVLTDRTAPEPGPGEIAIEVKAAGVNPADAKRREGVFGTNDPLPGAMGLEASGVVTAIGEGVSGFTVGDEVFGSPARGLGSFADHTVLVAETAAHKPEGVAFEDAAALPVAGSAAFDMVNQVDVPAGGSVLVLGASGGVGRMAMQLALDAGFRVVGVAMADGQASVEALGVPFVEAGPDATSAVEQLLPNGIDLLIDLVGRNPLRGFAPLVKDGSGIVSAADGDTAEEFGGAWRRHTPTALAGIVAAVARGVVDPNVTEVLGLDQAVEAMAMVEAGRATGKVVIVP